MAGWGANLNSSPASAGEGDHAKHGGGATFGSPRIPPPAKPREEFSGESPVKHAPAPFRNLRLLGRGRRHAPGESLLQHAAFQPAAFTEAAQLIERFGIHAGSEAALRADRSRDLGNFIHFCRWREVARMIELIRDEAVTGPVH